jgi:hypothetical protein
MSAATTTKAATARRVLAVDLGKIKSVACNCRDGTGQAACTKLDTMRIELHKLFVQRRPSLRIARLPPVPGRKPKSTWRKMGGRSRRKVFHAGRYNRACQSAKVTG